MVSDHSSKQRIKNIFYHSLGLLFNYLALYAFQHIKHIFWGVTLGLIMNADGVATSLAKVEAIVSWLVPTTI
jgi:hypothetical protein